MAKQSLFSKLFIALLVLSIIVIAPASSTSAAHSPLKVVVDADIGVDDAAAIAYLLSLPRSQVEILGVTAVAGNTSVENSANNALILLETAGRTNVPVVIGAASPLVLPASHQGAFVHGPDGLWFLGFQFPHDLSGLRRDAPEFLRDTAAANPGAVLLALGPLTNVAQAVQLYPNEMRLYSQVVWMGGSKVVDGDGNTPVSVFNPWFDPDAAAIVLSSGLPITMVTPDAGRQVTITERDIQRLAARGNNLGKLIAPALQAYSAAVNQSTEQSSSAAAKFEAAIANRDGHSQPKVTIPLYDPTAVVLALRPEWGTAQSALVFVQTPDGVARGQTIVGLTLAERISMLATDAELSFIADQVFSDPGFDLNGAIFAILMRQPDNAQVVLDVQARRISDHWLRTLLR